MAGSLEPPASAIDPNTGEPKSTMKSLDSIPGTWDRLLDSTNGDPTTGCNSDRFTCVMNDEAVRDNETGLVWEQSPGETDGVPGVNFGDRISWDLGRKTCAGRTVGGRLGWRLPSMHELASLKDPGKPIDDLNLPTGHPFNVPLGLYWSATLDASNSDQVWVVFFNGGTVVEVSKGLQFFVWCVRGANNADAY